MNWNWKLENNFLQQLPRKLDNLIILKTLGSPKGISFWQNLQATPKIPHKKPQNATCCIANIIALHSIVAALSKSAIMLPGSVLSVLDTEHSISRSFPRLLINASALNDSKIYCRKPFSFASGCHFSFPGLSFLLLEICHFNGAFNLKEIKTARDIAESRNSHVSASGWVLEKQRSAEKQSFSLIWISVMSLPSTFAVISCCMSRLIKRFRCAVV